MERESFKLFKEYSEATIVEREELALTNFLRFYQCGARFFSLEVRTKFKSGVLKNFQAAEGLNGRINYVFR